MSDEYKVLSDVDHVLQRPEQYVGDTTSCYISDWIWDEGLKQMVFKKKLMHNEGLIKTIFEVIDNCADNASRTIDPTTTIDVTMQNGIITVKNDGAGIRIERLALNGLYIPTTVFGVPRSGSKFNEDRNGTIGMNGLGVKLTNILSKTFSVVCVDKRVGKVFSQTWKNNMKDCGTEKIKDAPSNVRWTTIVSMVPDLDYFNRPENECNITIIDELIPVIHTRLLQVSVSHPAPLKIYFNKVSIKCKGIKAYMRLFPVDRTFFERVNDDFEYGVTISPDGMFTHQSIVNCQRTTSNDSTHTKYVTTTVVNAISNHLKKKGMSVRLSPSQISNNLFIFVNIRVKNPTFTSQTKVHLSTPIDVVKYPIDVARVMGLVKKSGLLQKLEDQLSQKALASMQSTLNGSKRGTVSIPKLDDAEEAGKSRSRKTTLFLVEGDSAKTMVTTGMSVIGRDYYGVFPLKGKLLNVIGASPTQLKDNTEIGNIMKIVGLNFGKTYDTDTEFGTLRYGNVCILCDADVDGIHITGLLLAFFNYYWPALIRRGFLGRFVTPIVKATRHTVIKRFFTMRDYSDFAAVNDMTGWKVQHLKGLGTSEKEDTLTYFKAMDKYHLKCFTGDDETADLINHIFDPKESNWRKDWLLKPMNTPLLDYSQPVMNISQFLRTEMYDFSIYNIKRAIPSAIDGLKVSQRKVLYTCFSKFKADSGDLFKVAQLAALAAAKTNYAHGEVSLQNTIINMAQSFSGSNNMPLLYAGGEFGSRRLNGADAASSRYIFTTLLPDARYLFKDRSENVLEYLIEENVKVEPKYYVPTLPLVLINGTNGIATGFRSLVPSFNPSDILDIIRGKLSASGRRKELVPWYGDTYRTNHKTRLVGDNWVFEGEIVYNETTRKITITEIPIGVSIEDYKIKVLDRMIEKDVIRSVSIKHPSPNEVNFVIDGYAGDTLDLIETFGLRKTMTTKCMNLLDVDGVIKNFTTPEAILEYWYEQRRKCVYDTHKEGVRVFNHVIEELFTKYQFIKAIVDGVVNIRKRKTAEIVHDLVVAGVSVDKEYIMKLLTSMSLSCLTVERYTELKNQHENKQVELEAYKKLTVDDLITSELLLFKVVDVVKRPSPDVVSPPPPKKAKRT
jgi:DNA topoisomerase-2